MVTMMVSFKWLWRMTRRGAYLLDRCLAAAIRAIPKTTQVLVSTVRLRVRRC
ncbi:hypothetical protein HMPREF1606_00999 [Escherichia coli 908522]|nr:hypothetical protein HMPREF1606_00999 [Escherichia coli 908522]